MRLTSLFRSPLLKTIQSKLDHYSQFHPSSLSIQSFLDFGLCPFYLQFCNIFERFFCISGREGNCKSSVTFLRKELLVRLACIMNEMALLPQDLLVMPSVKIVRGWYETSFHEILAYETAPNNEETCSK